MSCKLYTVYTLHSLMTVFLCTMYRYVIWCWANFVGAILLCYLPNKLHLLRRTLHILTYLLTYLLTYSMVQSTSWEANRFAASQEIPRISRNPKVHYRTHKRPPPISILGSPNPVHIPASYLLEIHPNIIHPSTPRSPQWSLSLRLPHQDPIHHPLLSHTRHMPSPSHSSRFYHPHNIGWGVQMFATRFGTFSGHHQAYQYKHHLEGDTMI